MIVTDESRLQDVWSLRLTTRRGILLSVGVVLAAVVLAAVLIMVTPLRSLLPGYMKEHQRADFIEALLKLDSLQNEYDRNQAFLRNITLVFDTDRVPTDSASMTKPDSVNVVDTIMPTSVEEQEFIKMMKEREKYNASILAPLWEELLFRGYVLRTLRPYGKRFAVMGSGVLFGLFHGNLLQTPYAVLMGLVLGYLTVEYSIHWAVLLHLFNNLVLADLLSRITASLPEMRSGLYTFINGINFVNRAIDKERSFC